jgi:hypothetical protein
MDYLDDVGADVEPPPGFTAPPHTVGSEDEESALGGQAASPSQALVAAPTISMGRVNQVPSEAKLTFLTGGGVYHLANWSVAVQLIPLKFRSLT